jgi:hypothetical protein
MRDRASADAATATYRAVSAATNNIYKTYQSISLNKPLCAADVAISFSMLCGDERTYAVMCSNESMYIFYTREHKVLIYSSSLAATKLIKSYSAAAEDEISLTASDARGDI